jgi:hypothetical protein
VDVEARSATKHSRAERHLRVLERPIQVNAAFSFVLLHDNKT